MASAFSPGSVVVIGRDDPRPEPPAEAVVDHAEAVCLGEGTPERQVVPQLGGESERRVGDALLDRCGECRTDPPSLGLGRDDDGDGGAALDSGFLGRLRDADDAPVTLGHHDDAQLVRCDGAQTFAKPVAGISGAGAPQQLDGRLEIVGGEWTDDD